ncbi:MAG: hypothetical protein ICV62_03615 [Cyanobacteria bacterium Co-bin13]|nr:hypothetical protein [Cyanobacteria bacterium Co-bin13]
MLSSLTAISDPTHVSLPEAAPVTEDHVLAAIVGVIQAARQQGQSLEEVQAAVLADDALLEQPIRKLLSDIVVEAWNRIG